MTRTLDLAAEFMARWPLIFAFDLARYLIAAGLAAAALHLLARRLEARRIRAGTPPGGQRGGEIAASLRTALIFSLVGFGIQLGIEHGALKVYSTIAERGWPYFAISLALSIVAQDAYFYWTHRAMHHPALFRWFHRRHHRSVLPTPWTAYAFDAPEALVQALFLPLFLAAVPMHGLAILLFLVHMIVRNVLGHSGYELLPRSLAHSRAWGWSNSVTHHDLHHETFRWNYGLYFTWWDRLMGTEHPQYRERLGGVRTAPALLLALLFVQAEPATANALNGEWATQGFSARVRIGPCDEAEGAVRVCGTIVWLWEPVDQSASVKKDASNPDVTLRDRPLVGVRLLEGFNPGKAGEWLDGTIYNPEDGRTYAATMSIGASGELRLRGCALAIFCKTQVWRRTTQFCPGAEPSVPPAAPRRAPLRVAVGEALRLEAALSQFLDGLEGHQAVGSPAIGDDFLPLRQLRQVGLELIHRDVDRARQHGAARGVDRLGGQDDRVLTFRKTAGSFAAGIASCLVRD